MSQRDATQAELNKFVKVVDEFRANYAHLLEPKTKADVYASGNPALISAYENAKSRGRILLGTIDAAVGAWSVFKSGYNSVTGSASTMIGDAVDEIRSWFGYRPMGGLNCVDCSTPCATLGGLGAIQIPAAIIITGIIASAMVLNKAMSSIFISVEASRIQRENPNVSREAAIAQAKAALPSLLPSGLSFPMLAVGGFALWAIFGRGK